MLQMVIRSSGPTASASAKAPAITSRLPKLRRAKLFRGSSLIAASSACWGFFLVVEPHGSERKRRR